MTRETIDADDARYPTALARLPNPPQALHVLGGADRLGRLLAAPTVAIVGARRATDYGRETARGLARGLAAGGVTVLGGLAEGIAAAAHSGALEVDGPTVTVMAGGADLRPGGGSDALWARLCERGCSVSEHAWGAQVKPWSHQRRMRIVVALARLVVVVEAEAQRSTLAPARLAQKLGLTVAAVPGRVSSPLSAGPHALLAEGACLVCDAQDALDALYGMGARCMPMPTPRHGATPKHETATARCEAPTLAAQGGPSPDRAMGTVLELIAGGANTLAKLIAAGCEPQAATLALAELELSGTLTRGDGGRYLLRAIPAGG